MGKVIKKLQAANSQADIDGWLAEISYGKTGIELDEYLDIELLPAGAFNEFISCLTSTKPNTAVTV
jgi:hypothetical protein